MQDFSAKKLQLPGTLTSGATVKVVGNDSA
jgi:hypothetical protein